MTRTLWFALALFTSTSALAAEKGKPLLAGDEPIPSASRADFDHSIARREGRLRAAPASISLGTADETIRLLSAGHARATALFANSRRCALFQSRAGRDIAVSWPETAETDYPLPASRPSSRGICCSIYRLPALQCAESDQLCARLATVDYVDAKGGRTVSRSASF